MLAEQCREHARRERVADQIGVIQSSESGWSNPLVVGFLLGAALLAAAFRVIETRVARPMLDLSLFRYPRFS
ncbi:hypothetical protein R69927_02414 [Paraburkholderia domus]|jgi:hypothetical protein|uniref:Uncharacterized protein n=1 Tax=Paraburkholderia domus TaxID=2793075 RepID=A0A9N8MW31_9BURK|nr:hypothetical protein [Paraburkholderia domus]CAE6731392.1 hypothetical protein R75483_02218 [Paraburkholderia domus]CAE6781285.1 hypothetical protein R70006_04414 [Paraburkholderia domus]CAE6805307.1 hypothetical protein R69749_02811 [Paraburkholderia domus]CAE6857464.1 hypothetical protein R69927_02414 [Paraburkholderia domus]CAE6888573.1 hypothetical protein R70199_02971 [Paraburkholderia domus]